MYINASGTLIFSFLALYLVLFLGFFFTTCSRACLGHPNSRKQVAIKSYYIGCNHLDDKDDINWVVCSEDLNTWNTQEFV